MKQTKITPEEADRIKADQKQREKTFNELANLAHEINEKSFKAKRQELENNKK